MTLVFCGRKSLLLVVRLLVVMVAGSLRVCCGLSILLILDLTVVLIFLI